MSKYVLGVCTDAMAVKDYTVYKIVESSGGIYQTRQTTSRELYSGCFENCNGHLIYGIRTFNEFFCSFYINNSGLYIWVDDVYYHVEVLSLVGFDVVGVGYFEWVNSSISVYYMCCRGLLVRPCDDQPYTMYGVDMSHTAFMRKMALEANS